ncbi:flagellar brake protein [Pusillimonas sp.]|uniref:flagellar brake protein n=1 Tax=Pusillimonas sp. TaxID=3040095 RepID=UPI0037C8A4B3
MKNNKSTPEHTNRYALTSQLDILDVLRSLALENRLIHMRATGGDASILTTLLHIDSKKEALIFDGSSDDKLSRQMLDAEKLHFEASQNGVHVSFATGPATSRLYQDRPALNLPYPAELIRIQRRDTFRVATPQNNPVLCTIPVENGAVTLSLEDLSGTGLGASDSANQLEGVVGQIYSGCTLALPGSEPLEITLRLVQMREFERAGKQLRHLGFAFENLRGAALARIQRYVSTLEREALAKSRGFR